MAFAVRGMAGTTVTVTDLTLFKGARKSALSSAFQDGCVSPPSPVTSQQAPDTGTPARRGVRWLAAAMANLLVGAILFAVY
jgi:hypothetical protein